MSTRDTWPVQGWTVGSRVGEAGRAIASTQMTARIRIPRRMKTTVLQLRAPDSPTRLWDGSQRSNYTMLKRPEIHGSLRSAIGKQ